MALQAIEPMGQSGPRYKRPYPELKTSPETGRQFPDPILKLSWDYGEKDAAGISKIDIHAVAKR